VLSGSFDLAAADAICSGDAVRGGAISDLLDHLVAKSIVSTSRRDERVRYRMLVTVRQFGVERLAELDDGDELATRHRDHYLGRAEAMARDWCGPGQAEVLADHANLRAALEWSLRRPDQARATARLAASLRYHWVVGGFLSEGRYWLDQALSALPGPCPERGEALWVVSWVCLVQGDHAAAAARLTESAALAERLGDAALAAHAAHWSGLAALFAGDPAGAVPLYERGPVQLRE